MRGACCNTTRRVDIAREANPVHSTFKGFSAQGMITNEKPACIMCKMCKSERINNPFLLINQWVATVMSVVLTWNFIC